MTTFRLAVSSRAEQDADVIYDWLAERSAVGAANWFKVFRECMETLKENPQRHSRAPEADIIGLDIRQALFKTRRGRPYRALFVVSEDTVHVVAVRGFGQDLATLDDLGLPD